MGGQDPYTLTKLDWLVLMGSCTIVPSIIEPYKQGGLMISVSLMPEKPGTIWITANCLSKNREQDIEINMIFSGIQRDLTKLAQYYGWTGWLDLKTQLLP